MMLKKLLATTALVAFAATSTFGIAQAAEVEGPEVKWNLSRCGATSAPSPPARKRWPKWSEAKTDGKFQITIPLRRSACPRARENLDGLSVGAFEAAMTCNFYHPQKNPALMVSHHAVPADGQAGMTTARSAMQSTSIQPWSEGTRAVECHAVHVVLPAAVRTARQG
jgi:TRAP-type mannitol/chloroaromatic compound transport system substrate-binding protein